jgi:hypothetical protein
VESTRAGVPGGVRAAGQRWRHAGVLRGWVEGDRLTFETIGDPPVRLRLTWDITGPADMRWRNEMSVGGGPWSLVEEYHCQPTGTYAPPG